MRQLLIFGLIFISSNTLLNAQINAVTETGDEVVLYESGTWKYLNEKDAAETPIPTNNKKFTKDKHSSFLIKSEKLNIGIWTNPKNWTFAKGTENDAFEYQLERKGEDLYAMLISEKMQIPINTLKGVAIENAKNAAPDIKVIKEEYRNVNGVQVLMMQMAGTIQGMRFTYYGYYYSNSNGTIQFLAYTSENLLNDYLGEIELLLNGLVEL